MNNSTINNSSSLESHVIPDSVPIRLSKHRVVIRGDQISAKPLNIEIEIPKGFEDSRLCQSLISYAYTDYFLSLRPPTRYLYACAIRKFYNFINCSKNRLHYIKCVNLSDLPYTVIHEFALSISGLKAQTIRLNVRQVAIAAERIADSLILDFPVEASHLKNYTLRRHLPEFKRDDRDRVRSLSQLYSEDQLTGAPIACPYLDSELIKSMRGFCVWYLNILQERRRFLREVKTRTGQTIYELIIENLSNGVWSFDSAPVIGLRDIRRLDVATILEWSELYATLYRALTPSSYQLECMRNGAAEKNTSDKLLWAEPLVTNRNDRAILSRSLVSYPAENTIERLKNFVVENRRYRINKNKSNVIPIPLALNFENNVRSGTISPVLTLAELIVPSPTEARLMSWLLASDCIQISNQVRLQLSDLKALVSGEVSRIINAVDLPPESQNVANGVFIRHKKDRAKGKSWNTRSYPKHSEIRKAYESWVSTINDARHLLPPQWQNKWFPSQAYVSSIAHPRSQERTHLICACLPGSLTQNAWLSHQEKEPINKEAIIWLLSQEIKQQWWASSVAMAAEKKARGEHISYITISVGAIRESRIIFEETSGKTDSERARYDAHSETMASYYRTRGMAKERILMCIKGNAQVSDKMIEEAMLFIDQVEFVKLDDVTKAIHGSIGDSMEFMALFEAMISQSSRFEITPFGGFRDSAQSSLKLINDEKTAWMILCYVRHLEDELDRIEANHDEQVIKWIFEHAIYDILFDRFPEKSKEFARSRFETHKISYPPIH